jgi:hypothetical protein
VIREAISPAYDTIPGVTPNVTEYIEENVIKLIVLSLGALLLLHVITCGPWSSGCVYLSIYTACLHVLSGLDLGMGALILHNRSGLDAEKTSNSDTGIEPRPVRSISIQLLQRSSVAKILKNSLEQGSVVVEALYYKPKGRGFHTRWGEWTLA